VKTNKDDLNQPAGVENGILPKMPFGALLIGRTGSGKTLCMINMLTNPNLLEGYFDEIHLFVGVKPDQEMIKSLQLKKEHIYEDFKEEDVKNLFQKAEKEVGKKGMSKSKKRLFIFDDVLGNKRFMRSDTMRKLCTANRHANVSYMVLSQYYKFCSPVIRTNTSYIVYFPASDIENQKLADEQCPPNLTKKEFLKLVKYATKEKYSFLSINTRCECDKQLRKGFNDVINL
jgi:hypothetical protein